MARRHPRTRAAKRHVVSVAVSAAVEGWCDHDGRDPGEVPAGGANADRNDCL